MKAASDCTAYAPWRRAKMAENNVEPEHEWSDRALDTAEDTLVAMETLLATLRAFEDVLRQQEMSIASSTEYCDNFCQALMHYAGSRNSMEHGLPLLEVYCLSINCFAAARSHLTAESDRVALVLKRLALSCFELLLSVPENEIPYEAWLQFHHSVQSAHDTLLQYGSTDLQALLQITGEGGAWSNPVLTSLLTGQPTNTEEVDAYISLEGEGFMEMRVKHLEKMGEVAKAVVLAKACTECSFISNQATFRQTCVSLLCHLLPNEEAIMEISRLDCKDVLEITCNLETEGEENTAFILCTTFLTQQLQQQSLYCSWELTLLWSKLQRRIDPSLMSLLERCLQLGAIAKTVHHLLYLVRVIQTEAEEMGVPASVELCVKALQLPKHDDSETRISVCKTVSCLLPDDLEVLRACLLTEFLLGPCQEVFGCLEELYLRPDQKYDQENEVIPNSLRCELLLALKAYWPFDPEFWDWKTLKYHCSSLLGLVPESEGEEEEVVVKQEAVNQPVAQEITVKVESEQNRINGSLDSHEQQDTKPSSNLRESQGESETKKHKFSCKICKRTVIDSQIIHHSKRHAKDNCHPCPVCLEKFKSRKDLVPHMKEHIPSETQQNNVNDVQKQTEEDDDIEPGEITIDPSLMLYYKSTHDPDVLHHIVQQAKIVKEKHVDDDEHVTFEYIDQHFKLQNRDEYQCPGTGCTRIFKHSKYLYVHLKSEHKGDENVKHFHQMRDKREKCVFCRRHFVSAYHHRKHRRVHYGDRPYSCVVIGCGAQFSTSNELVTHKQIHGYQLNYQCELKGCYVTYSDLGQIYHHEAQHFRDAAFTCSSAECTKYYLSKKEFIKHLSTHNITFSEEDFEAQRKAKRKLFKTITEVTPSPSKSADTEEVVDEVLNSPSVSCASSLPASENKESKATMTLVAVCFDGSKFTCGFEKCGMTFSRARDVQRHLKCAHPEHLKLENKEHKHDKERGSKSKGVKPETEPDHEEKGKNELPTPSQPADSGNERKSSTTQPKNNETNSSSLQTNNDALKEILIGLSKLDLNSSSPHSVPSEPPQSNPESNASQISLHQAILAKPPIVLLQKRPPHPPVEVKAEEASAADDQACVESLATAKPYICAMKGCSFRTAQSYSLLRHYNTRHGRTVEQAKRLTSLKTTSFKPYVCHLCSKSHREKHVLRAHYVQVHNLSETLVGKISCASVRYEGNKDPSEQTPQQMVNHGLKVRKKEIPNVQHQHKKKNSENAQNFDNHSPSEEEGEDEPESREEDSEEKGEGEDRTQQVRTTRRLVAKSNLCYILDKFSKPFHCVAKNCDAAFSTQGGLVRHLQLVHHYNRSQLLLEKDFDAHHSPEVRKEPAKKRPLTNSDEPQPQYKCHFANCSASYHLKSSLVRHTRDYHSQPPELIRCKYEGCTRVFSHDDALKKHTLYSHYEYYDSLVVRLQSTHKKSITGCQKKLIVAPQSPQKEEPGSTTTTTTTSIERSNPEPEVPPQSEEMVKVEEKPVSVEKNPRRNSYSRFVFRAHEEALQMCQDRCLRVAYPCMVQDCDSVVTYMGSLHRHYLKVHRMRREDLFKNEDKLVFNAEQLEELIQRKSARPTATGACTPNGVRKLEYQAEPENTGGQPAPMSLQSIKTDTQDEENHDSLGFPEEEEEDPPPVERNGVLVGADEVLYGEPSTGGHAEDSAAATPNNQKQEERLSLDQIKPLLRPVTVDLSPPCSLRFTTEEGFQDISSTKDGGKILNGSSPTPPVRQPLKRKNELSEQPSNLKDSQPCSPSPRPFDIATYKPIGFESSFLRFIQETTPNDKNNTGPVKRRDSFRRSCSVKENNQLGISHTRSRRTHSPLLKPHAMTGDFTSVQNLKSILDKALAGCGDLAIKQLQYLRPVVVLGRPVCTTTLPDLFPSDTNNSKLLLGS
ncbi:Zinc finger protein Rlf Rearranged L-myc fusion gene protein Zn-15-related protein [Larimichthys crocea]|uniref:Zinc finger protein Rlf Rearranged L-myc fusion gene protein Zn-15-related protein n=1 Tax=Larimichthys crocea TaxID=215358 RepID=A0A6G0IEL5_LARCR|nr:Zinc finger protein Rlf Rearranged L-myc fusion gene protein Zn-15-related protein [Larimichthys crocea]